MELRKGELGKVDGFVMIDRRPPQRPKPHNPPQVFRYTVLYAALREAWSRV